MKQKKAERKTPGKRKVKREVKITLWLLFISVVLLVGFSLWGNHLQPASQGATGAVIGIDEEANTTANDSNDTVITITPESNTTIIDGSNNGGNTSNVSNMSNFSNSSNDNSGNDAMVGNGSNSSYVNTTNSSGTSFGILDEPSEGIGIAGGGIGIAEDANSTACGYVNSDVTLTSNIDTAVSCFVLNTSNVVIDGAGFTVNGSQASLVYGVNITGFNNVTIKNLNIRNFSISYFITKSRNSTVFNSSGDNSSNIHVKLVNVYGLNFTNNTINNATNQLMDLTSVNQSMFQNNRLVIVNDIVMLFNQPVSQNNNITGNNISFLGTETSTSAIEMGTTTTSNNIDIYNNTFHMTRARAGILGGYNGEVRNNTFYLGLKGDITGNAYAIDPTTNRDMLYQGNTILGFAQRSNGIGSGSAGSNLTFRENFLNLTGSLSEGFSFTTNVGDDNVFEGNIVLLNNTNGPGFSVSAGSTSNRYVLVNNTFVNPNMAYQVQLVGPRVNYTLLNNTYRVVNFTSNTVTSTRYTAIQWWVKVNITAPNGTVITSANVTAYNKSGGIEQSFLTDASGLVKFNLTETFRNGSVERTVFNSPHNITATASGYLINFTSVNISATNSTQIDLVLAAEETVTCGYVNSNINLTNNINTTGSCFVVNASNIIVDGKGYMVTGNRTGGYGVNITSFNNVTVENMVLYNFTTAVFLTKSSNSTVFNITANNSSDNGIRAINSFNLSIIQNTVFNASNEGIDLQKTNGSLIRNNTVNATDQQAILLTDAINNVIERNRLMLTGTGAGTIGVIGFGSIYNGFNEISNNSIVTYRANGAGVLNSNRNNYTNNTFIAYGTSGILYTVGSDDDVYRGNTFTATSNFAGGFDGTATSPLNVTFEDNFMNITGNSGNGIEFGVAAGRNHTFSRNIIYVNGTASGAQAVDWITNEPGGSFFINNTFITTKAQAVAVRLTHARATLLFINNVFNNTNVSFGTDHRGLLWFQWYVLVNVTAANGTALSGVNVTAYNSFGGIEQTLLTEASGLARFNLTDYSLNGSSTAGASLIFNYSTPHTVNATLANYIQNSTSVNISQTHSTQINLVLAEDTVPLVQGFNTPVNRQNFTTGDTVIFNGSISDTGSIHVVRFQIENGTNGLVNVTASATNGTLYNFSITIGSDSGIAEGNRTVTIFANDTVGNMNNSVSITFVVDRTAPSVIQLYNLTERSNISKNVPTFSFQVNDSLSPSMSCELVIDSVVNVTAISSANGTTINQVASRSLVDGNHNWSVNCNDSVRISNISITNNFTIDSTPPYNITLNEPSDASTQTSSSVRFNWTAMDALFATMSCNLTINGVVNQSNIATTNGTQTNVTVSSLSDGTYSWNVTCADVLLSANTSATQTFTIDTSTPSAPTTGGTSGGGSSGGGAAAAAPSAPSSETAPATRTPSREAQTYATPTEVQQLLREQRFTISVVPTVVTEVAREERQTALQTALTGRAIGPPPERQVERRSLVNVRRVSVTFVNDGDKPIRITPAIRDRSPIKLVDERRAEELVEERIRAALPLMPVKSLEEVERMRAVEDRVEKDIRAIENINDQLQDAKTIAEVKERLQNIDPKEIRLEELQRLEMEIENVKNVKEAKLIIDTALEAKKKQQQEITKQIKTDDEIGREVEDTIETLKKVEEERVQFISSTKALAPQKGLFFLPNVDGSVSYSGGHTTGKLLKTEILNGEETIVGARQSVTKEFDVRLPISLTPKPVTLSFATGGEEILTKEVDVKEKIRVGTALHVDPQQGIIDAYILVPREENAIDTEKNYLLEFNINERQSFFFPSSRYSEIFGPYQIKQNTIFAQELSYDREAYTGTLPVSLKIYEDGELIAENDYTVDFGTGTVKEGFDLSMLTGFAVTGRAVFADLNQNTQKYSTYLVDGLLLLVLVFFLIVGVAYLHRMAVGVIPHRPIAGAVPRRKVTMMPKSIRSIFFEKELSHLNQRLSSLEREEISGLLRQEELVARRQLGRPEEASRIIPPTILQQSERYKSLDKELLKVQSAIERVEKTQLQRSKIRTLLSSYRPTTTFALERKTVIDKELEKVTKTLGRAERRPASLLERLFQKRSWKEERDTEKARRDVLRISRKVEGKEAQPSNELLEIERKIFDLDKIKEKNVKIRKDIPTLLERGKQTVKEILLLEKEKAKIERNLERVDESKSSGSLQRLVRPTKELSDIEQRLANVDGETEIVKGKVLTSVASVNVYDRESGLKEALRQQRPLQKRELKRSPELEEIEKAIMEVEKPISQQKKSRTAILSSIPTRQNRAVEELRELAKEYHDVDLLLKGEIQETLRKRRIAMPTPSRELLNVERKIAQVETMFPRKVKIKREIPGASIGLELGNEKKSNIDKELDEITRALQRAEKRPISLLESLFPRRKSKTELHREKEAIRDVVRISKTVKGMDQIHTNELDDVERQLANVEKEGEKIKQKVITRIATVNVFRKETDIEEVLRERRATLKREVKPSRELMKIENAITDVEKRLPQKINVRATIPDHQPVKHSVLDQLQLSKEYQNVDILLRENRAGTLGQRRKQNYSPSPELLDIERKIAGMEEMVTQKVKIRRELPRAMPEREQVEERRAAIDQELEEITQTLERGERKPASLLERLFPKRKSASEKKKEREAVREVVRISRKVERKNPRPANELIDVEKKLEKLKRELKKD